MKLARERDFAENVARARCFLACALLRQNQRAGGRPRFVEGAVTAARRGRAISPTIGGLHLSYVGRISSSAKLIKDY